MDILNKIDKLRMEKDWTIYRLAEESLLNQSTIANMFARKTQPSIATLTNICNGLGITLSQFFADGENEVDNENEKEIICNYKKLSKKEKNAVMLLIKSLIETKK